MMYLASVTAAGLVTASKLSLRSMRALSDGVSAGASGSALSAGRGLGCGKIGTAAVQFTVAEVAVLRGGGGLGLFPGGGGVQSLISIASLPAVAGFKIDVTLFCTGDSTVAVVEATPGLEAGMS
jgi:hypothetical protein